MHFGSFFEPASAEDDTMTGIGRTDAACPDEIRPKVVDKRRVSAKGEAGTAKWNALKIKSTFDTRQDKCGQVEMSEQV